ncbi:ribonuclease HI family protein [Zoogloea sp. LCSB751]|uniref:ribonuclease HI family protein n=1 Tax=Zoogloea sp. LCSB751 TaxID=1965277 RepID=UPI0009A4CBD8|nr:ribonuclease HI family protein [Zoogloea sp. LCSB751]
MNSPPHLSTEWQIWFDGSAYPNPGRLGLGALLRGPDGQHIELSTTAHGNGCNNEAELLALEQALRLAGEAGAAHLRVRGDSDFVVRHLNGEARTDIARLHGIIERLQTELGAFVSVRLEWVPRHRNPDADRLSRAALGLPDKPAPRPISRRRRR